MKKLFRTVLKQRLKERSDDFWEYLLKYAWIAVFKEIFDTIIGKDPPFSRRVFVAICFTLISIFVTIHTTSVSTVTTYDAYEDDD